MQDRAKFWLDISHRVSMNRMLWTLTFVSVRDISALPNQHEISEFRPFRVGCKHRLELSVVGKVCGATSAGLACTLLNTNMVRFDGVAEAEGDGRGFKDRSSKSGSFGEGSERTSSPPTT